MTAIADCQAIYKLNKVLYLNAYYFAIVVVKIKEQ